ncbi:hypothetical protein FQN54_006983 [Arachnomyces sp. PD_36]|nr:hypothetical protein FQN54_006983 [Arachnomyces sp. PD_36]
MAEAAKDSKVMDLPRDPAMPGEPTATASSSSRPAPSRNATAPIGGSGSASNGAVKQGVNSTASALSNSNSQQLQQNTRKHASQPTLLRSSSTQHYLARHDSQSGIDPLSQHILQRTMGEKGAPPRARTQTSLDGEPGASDAKVPMPPPDSTLVRSDSNVGQKTSREKKNRKSVSFLSRIIGTKKKDPRTDTTDNASEPGESRAAGMDAEIFAHPIGFIPRFPPPPKYIKVRSHFKKEKHFDRVFVAQELRGANALDEKESSKLPDTPTAPEPSTERAIWALVFSNDGKYLAAAGQDKIVRVWAVIATEEDRQAHETEEDAGSGDQQPGVRLSAPVFKTKPIREYDGHKSSVLDLSWSKNNFLLSSSMDKTVRLWHVSRSECLCCFQHSDFVTSIQFHPRDDRFFLAGSLDSKLRLWSIPDKSVAFWAKVPDMVTAVSFTPDGKHSIAGCLNGLCIIYETDGLKPNSQLHVRSARGKNAKGSKIAGIDTIIQPPNDPHGEVKLLITSNDSRIRLYNFRDRSLEAKFRGNENACSQIHASFSDDGRHVICGSEDRRAYIWNTGPGDRESDKRAVELFEAHSTIVTTAIMAPTKTKQLLGYSGDPVYDLCNPPPVTLVSQADSMQSSRPPTESGRTRPDDKYSAPSNNRGADSKSLRAEGSPAYLARSSHAKGNIIVTADYTGSIKVFRQDCAQSKRRHDTWDNNSISKKILGRTSSVTTRNSVASSARDSFHKSHSERILNWRNSIVSPEHTSLDSLRAGANRPPSAASRKSHQPSKSANYAQQRSGISTHPTATETTPTLSTTSPPVSRRNSSTDSKEDPLMLHDGYSYRYWNKAKYAAQAANPHRPSKMLDPEDLQPRKPSDISSEYTSDNNDTEDEEMLRCANCHGVKFRATRTKSGEQRLICGKCGKPNLPEEGGEREKVRVRA